MKRMLLIGAAIMLCGPVMAFECKFKGAPQADFKTYKTNTIEPEYRLKSGAVLEDKGSIGTGLGHAYEVTTPKGETYMYGIGQNPIVKIGEARFNGSCR